MQHTRRTLLPLIVLLLLLITALPLSAEESRTVTLVHMTDYHSHAVPFYAEGEHDMAGIARVIEFLEPYAADPNALVFSGGDTMNKGTPAWSDKYRCAEWPWLNGIVDAMAYGNHDADYGPDVFADCRAQIDYPILSSNTLAADGESLFQYDGKRYRIFDLDGIEIGVFAVAGSDFSNLIGPATLPAEGVTFGDRIEAAREDVAAMQAEGADAIVLIGHSLYEDDVDLAQAVSGIDLILGSHSHRKAGLELIPETQTRYISSFQYLTYLSRVELTFNGEGLSDVEGGLVRMGSDLPEDGEIKARVEQMQEALENDPDYAHLFVPIGEAAIELSTDGQFTGESLLGNFVMDIFRDAAGAHMAIQTASSFRQPIAPGPILEEDLRSAMPYKNGVYVFEMTGEQIRELLQFSVSRSPSDFFSQLSGVRFDIVNGRVTRVMILEDPAEPSAGYGPLHPERTYSVATSDFQAFIAGGYKEIFAGASDYYFTGIEDIRDDVRRYIGENSPVSAELDGRINHVGSENRPERANRRD